MRILSTNGLASIAAGVALTGFAFAGPITPDTDVSPNVIFGSGVTNGGWAVSTSNGVEVGLRAKTRLPSPLNDASARSGGDTTYEGFATQTSGTTGTVTWNYEFAVNLRAENDGAVNWSDFVIELLVDTDPTANATFITIPVIAFWNDNAFGTNSTAQSGGDAGSVANTAAQAGNNNGYQVVQNSQNLGFLDGPGSPFFNMERGDATWDFVLNVNNPLDGGALLASTSMTVVVGNGGAPAPVPAPGVLGLLGLAGLFGAGRRLRARFAR